MVPKEGASTMKHFCRFTSRRFKYIGLPRSLPFSLMIPSTTAMMKHQEGQCIWSVVPREARITTIIRGVQYLMDGVLVRAPDFGASLLTSGYFSV